MAVTVRFSGDSNHELEKFIRETLSLTCRELNKLEAVIQTDRHQKLIALIEIDVRCLYGCAT